MLKTSFLNGDVHPADDDEESPLKAVPTVRAVHRHHVETEDDGVVETLDRARAGEQVTSRCMQASMPMGLQ